MKPLSPLLFAFAFPILINAQEPAANEGTGADPAAPASGGNELERPDFARLVLALQTGDVEAVLEITKDSKDEELLKMRASVLQNRGEIRFFKSDIEGSIEDFDEVIALFPERDPYHWQRGISYYYADRFEDGKAQFERHQTVNTQDVENAVWHFLCSVRAPGGSVESARAELIPITGDTRVPMKEVHALFAGKGTGEAVLEAAVDVGNPKKSDEARNAMMYAHLYLALYYEALGETEKVKQHITSAAGEFSMNHYMGQVAKVHAGLRGIEIPAP